MLGTAIFWGLQVLDIVISEGGQFRTLFFSGFWHIGKYEGGKKDQTPCKYPKNLVYNTNAKKKSHIEIVPKLKPYSPYRSFAQYCIVHFDRFFKLHFGF